MLKRDPIFWWATGIFVLALLLFAITQSQFWLVLGIGSYLLRPTLASLGIGRKRIDERELTIHYRSGNIGFAVMMIVCVIFTVKLAAENNHDFELFVATIIIGLAAKALFNVILIKDLRKAAAKILIGAGLLIALFSSFHTFDDWSLLNMLMAVSPGLAIAGIGVLSRTHPRPAGVLTLVAAAILLWMILTKRGFDWGQTFAAVVVCVPLILAALCLFTKDKADSFAEPTNTA